MSSLSEILKKRRKELGLTLAQIAEKMGVTEATVQRWESGNIKSLRHGKIAKLAEVLDVSPASIMGWDEPSASSSIDIALSSDLASLDAQLNTAGHAELVNYAEFLVLQSEYKKIAGSRKTSIRLYTVPAAAGYASPIEGEDYEIIELDDVPPGADYCIRVSGDSMEPYIRDGSYVYVKRNADLSDFDVGVFYLDGDVLVKQVVTDSFRNVYLLSANPKRANANRTIWHDSSSTLVCLGRVIIGKLPRPNYVRPPAPKPQSLIFQGLRFSLTLPTGLGF